MIPMMLIIVDDSHDVGGDVDDNTNFDIDNDNDNDDVDNQCW